MPLGSACLSFCLDSVLFFPKPTQSLLSLSQRIEYTGIDLSENLSETIDWSISAYKDKKKSQISLSDIAKSLS